LKDKHFRIPENQATDFEVLCKLLGIPEKQAGQIALREWVRRNKAQVSLEVWTETRGSVAPMNNALIKLHLTILKADLREVNELLERVAPEHQLEFLRKAQKMIPTALALIAETDDQELRQIVAEIVRRVSK
jgi:hypothetical protein